MAPWLRALFALFGLSNIGGAVYQVLVNPRDWWIGVAGVLVGGAWFTVGAMGTLPVFATTAAPATTVGPSEERLTAGLRTIRCRQHRIWLSLLWMPLAVALLMAGSDVAALGVGLVGALTTGILSLVYGLSACPRCGHGFFAIPGTGGLIHWPTRQCRHCGLGYETV